MASPLTEIRDDCPATFRPQRQRGTSGLQEGSAAIVEHGWWEGWQPGWQPGWEDMSYVMARHGDRWKVQCAFFCIRVSVDAPSTFHPSPSLSCSCAWPPLRPGCLRPAARITPRYSPHNSCSAKTGNDGQYGTVLYHIVLASSYHRTNAILNISHSEHTRA